MKQVVQKYKTGDLWLEDVPVPSCRPGGVLVRNEFSVISPGTERMKVTQARMSLAQMARARPDQVKTVLQSISKSGLAETYQKVQERLDALSPLGYSSCGRVVEVGEGIDNIGVGDLVACSGEGIACHAEYCFVPKNMCVVVPEGVQSRDAAYATLGAIAMNGVRQADVSLGDSVCVIGLGLVGQLAVQLLKSAGCRVIGIDLTDSSLEKGKISGADLVLRRDADNLEDHVRSFTNGHGIDRAYIAASSSNSDPIRLAGTLCRDRGKIVVVGMLPVEAEWRDLYSKEIEVVMSRSYGPGRYDPVFEAQGVEYPIGYVPWSMKRNLQEFLRLINDGHVSLSALEPAVYSISDAVAAYQELHQNAANHSSGILFRYPTDDSESYARTISEIRNEPPKRKASGNAVGVAIVGVGNFATGTLIPQLKRISNCKLVATCSAGGLTAKGAASRHGFDYSTTDFDEILGDENVEAVVIATRHDSHASLATRALDAGKNVFVEKPLALDEDDLQALESAASRSSGLIMPGFNRRFVGASAHVRNFFTPEISPVQMICRVSAGVIGKDSWYQDAREGGWRIVSEGCHWIDLMAYFCRSLPCGVSAHMIGGTTEGSQNDSCIATVQFENGSVGTLAYFSNGDSGLPKERIEVFGQERTAVINNWKQLELWQNGSCKKTKIKGGKGHLEELQSFIEAIANSDPAPISREAALRVTRATFDIREALLRKTDIGSNA